MVSLWGTELTAIWRCERCPHVGARNSRPFGVNVCCHMGALTSLLYAGCAGGFAVADLTGSRG